MIRDKVIIFEDDGSALAFVEVLKEFENFDIYQTTNWSHVVSWLKIDPKADKFAALIFDLQVPSYKLDVYNNEPYKKEKHYYPSLYFIDNFIKPNYPELLSRIIIYSAYLSEFDKIGRKQDEFIKFAKDEDGSVNKMIAKVKELRGNSYE